MTGTNALGSNRTIVGLKHGAEVEVTYKGG